MTKQLQIAGVTCVHCEKTVANASTRMACKVEADLKDGRAKLETVDATDEELKAAVEDAGYTVISIADARTENEVSRR